MRKTSKKHSFKCLKSFLPVIDRKAKILILGTMPGPESLRARQYYAFERNAFWKIMIHLFRAPRAPKKLSYAQRLKLLKRKKVALWDVIKSCERGSALDSDIKRPRYNAIAGKLRQFPRIKAVFLNGHTAEEIFKKQFSPSVAIPAYYLPSTSPANARLSFAKKLKAWSVILSFL